MTVERRVVGDLGNAPELRSGRFAKTYQGPDKHQGGLDWDKIRADYYARMRAQVAEGKTDRETMLWVELGLAVKSDSEIASILEGRAIRRAGALSLQKSSLTPEDRARGGRSGGARKANVPEIVRLYTEEDMKPEDIARDQGIRVETVRDWLKRRQVWDPNKFRSGWKGDLSNRGPGPKPRETCSRGHDLTLPGATTQIWKTTSSGRVKNGRACIKCWGGVYGS